MSSRSEKRLAENLPASAENAASEFIYPEFTQPRITRPELARPEFTYHERGILLGIARAAVASGLAGEPLPDSPPGPSSPTLLSPSFLQALAEPRGVFTTIYLEHQLRGCVGYALPIHPLYRAIAESARAAAFEDTRFWPVTPEEAGKLQFSLSVLSPLFRIAAGGVEVGRHGLADLRRQTARPAAPSGARRTQMGPRDLPCPNLPQGRLAARRLAEIGDHRGFYRRGIRRRVRRAVRKRRPARLIGSLGIFPHASPHPTRQSSFPPATLEDGTLVTLFSPLDGVLWLGVKHRIPRGVWVIWPFCRRGAIWNLPCSSWW